MNFSEFSLHEDLLKGITAAGYVTCTPVQEQVLKTSLTGDDLYVQSQTGTGKTAAYLVSIIQELLANPENAGKKTLILVPTRELAVQVEDEAKKLLSATGLKAFSFYGGVGYKAQVEALEHGVDFIVGTPGRIIDLKKGGQLDLSGVKFLVIDEADRMFDMGFYPDLREILKFIPKAEERQTMLFSATLNTYVKNLAWEYTRDAKEVTIEAENITVDEIDQELIHVSSDKKLCLLLGILEREKPASVLIFCNTKKGCEILGKRLKINGYQSEFIIGDMQQSKRLEVLNKFKEGKVSMLVATDVAARGIDVTDLAMVVNYDLPNEPENYVHRIGRTARAGKSGKAYTFCSEKDVYDLPVIERYINKQIPASVSDDSLLVEDKSKDVYIKLDDYGWGGDDERDERRGRRGRGDGRGRSDRERGHGRRDRDEERRGRDARRGRGRDSERGDDRRDRTGREAFDQSLEGLSFEERMEVYKKKYAASPASAKGARDKAGRADGYGKKRRDGKGRNYERNSSYNGGERRGKGKAQNSARGLQKNGAGQNASKKAAKNSNVAKKKTLQNKGILGFLSGLFGGKK